MGKYRKKPGPIFEAMQYTGQNGLECVKFSDIGLGGTHERNESLTIDTWKKPIIVKKWDWVVKGKRRTIPPAKFHKYYESAE